MPDQTENPKPQNADTKKQEPKLPICPHCGAVPIACRQPNDCKFEELRK